MEKTSDEIVKYFKGTYIGSYLFVQRGLLTLNDINDFDIAVELETLPQIYSYLEDKKYEKKKLLRNVLNYPTDRNHIVFSKDGYKPIHLFIKGKDFQVKGIYDIIAMKLRRKLTSDYDQVLKVIDNLRKEEEL